MQLTGAQRRYLRGAAHSLKPVVQIGKMGLVQGTLAEIETALKAHELIKVRFTDHKDRKQALSREIEKTLEVACAGLIGSIAILYRPNPEKPRRIRLPASDSA